MSVLPYRLGPVLLVSALAGQAIAYNRGAYAEPAILCVVLGLVLLLTQYAAVFARPAPRVAGDPHLTLTCLWIALFAMWWTAISDPFPLMYAQRVWQLGKQLQWWSLLLLATYLPWLSGRWKEPRVLTWARFAGVVGFVLLAGIDTIQTSPRPFIDVWGIQTQAAQALLEGKNPFAVVAVLDTGPGTLIKGVPFVYPPTQIYVTLLGWKLGDVRYTMLAAVLIAGVAMRFMARGPGSTSFGKDAPALFLFMTPKLFFVVEQAWVDPVQVMFITIALACARWRRLSWAAIAFGIASSSKQTMFWLPPLAGFCLGFRVKHWAIMLVAAILPPLPFVIWDFQRLKYANFDVLNGLPDRPDSLTLNNWALYHLQFHIPGSVGFALATLVVAFACWRLRGVSKCALAIATTYYVFFAFNRWAFANYYFLISALAAVAAAALWSELRGSGLHALDLTAGEQAQVQPRPSAPTGLALAREVAASDPGRAG